MRESIFNVLNSGRFDDPIEDARVLDLFAGTGALGFEALSRGAAHTTFVDGGSTARALIRENMSLTKSGGVAKLFRRDATKLGQCQSEPFSLIFLDPPYGKDLGLRALDSALTGGWLADGALVVWEENAPQNAPDAFELLDQRRYGDTHISILEYTP